MTAAQMVRALEAEGVNVTQMDGWKTHSRNHKGAWGEVYGLLVHHTAGVSKAMAEFCYNGTRALPGPLCHAMAAKSGRVYLVGNGRANHAGTVAVNAMTALRNEYSSHPRPDAAEPLDGNRQLYGIEIENEGNGRDPYPAKQYDQSVRWAAAICRFHKWTADSIGGHKEVTRRKIDPSFPMDTFRRKVAERLAHSASWSPGAPAPAPAPSTGSDIVNYTQLSRIAPLHIPGGSTLPVYFDVEHSDEPNDHGNGARTVLVGGVYNGNVAVWVPENSPRLGVLMTQELPDTSLSTSSTADIDTDPAVASCVSVPITGHVPADRKLLVQIKNYGPATVTLQRVDIRFFSQVL